MASFFAVHPSVSKLRLSRVLADDLASLWSKGAQVILSLLIVTILLALLGGVIRTFSEGVTDAIEAGLRRLAGGIAQAHGCTAEVHFRRASPPVVNHEKEARCYAFIGNGEGDHRLPDHGGGPCIVHNTSFDFNDEIIPVGASYFVRLAQRWLAR